MRKPQASQKAAAKSAEKPRHQKSNRNSIESMQPLDRLATFANDIAKFKKWYSDKKKIIDSLPGKTSVDQAS